MAPRGAEDVAAAAQALAYYLQKHVARAQLVAAANDMLTSYLLPGYGTKNECFFGGQLAAALQMPVSDPVAGHAPLSNPEAV